MANYGDTPQQGTFIGWLAIALIGVMAIFALVLLMAGLRG
jgi:hypothetical protein